MRKIIPPDPAALSRRASIVEGSYGDSNVVVEIDGQRHRLGPDEAKRIGRAMLQAASLIETPPVYDLDDMDDLDDDVPGV